MEANVAIQKITDKVVRKTVNKLDGTRKLALSGRALEEGSIKVVHLDIVRGLCAQFCSETRENEVVLDSYLGAAGYIDHNDLKNGPTRKTRLYIVSEVVTDQGVLYVSTLAMSKRSSDNHLFCAQSVTNGEGETVSASLTEGALDACATRALPALSALYKGTEFEWMLDYLCPQVEVKDYIDLE